MKLTLNQFFDSIKDVREDLIVQLMYKYHCDVVWNISNEILTYDGDHDDWIWEYDWDEGYSLDPKGVYVTAYVPVSEVKVWEQMVLWRERTKKTNG